jgi:serine/threonine-protein kinase
MQQLPRLGKYELVRKLAMGGMAEVFLAKAAGPMGFEKTLVLKRILPDLAQESSFIQMFLSEAKLVARLTHPNIVQIFDFGESEGTYFVAMEYIDGPSLRTLVKRAGAQGLFLPPTVCARLISQACEGLAYAHDFADPDTGEPLGIIHRDVSPDNILLSRQGAVKVVDFGIAKAAGQSHKTESGVVKGKLAYMPPEQLRAKALDRRADVYALGVVLYELLTGQRPYTADSEARLMQAILYEPPTPAAQLRPDLPQPLRRILSKALAKEREQRYPDCHALQVDLESFIVSVGTPVMTQQVARLITQANTNPELPVLAPIPVPTPVPTPPAAPRPSEPPFLTRKHSASVSSKEVTANLRTPPVSKQQEPETRVSRPPPLAAAPSPSPGAPAVRRPVVSAAKPQSSNRWATTLVGGVLLAACGGVVSWYSELETQRPTLAVENPPSQVAVAPAEPSEPPLPPRPDVGGPDATSPEPAPVEPRPERSPIKPKRSAPVAHKEQLKGTVELRIRPYATVFVNGKRWGVTPLKRPLELPEGRHILKFVNEKIPKTKEMEIDVKAGLNDLLKVNLLEE